METLVKVLKHHNCKITPQRLAVYNILKESKEHPNAESIYNMLVPTYPTISLATVYKSLELFVDLGLISVINVGENSFRYDCRASDHAHVVCSKCYRVEDLDDQFFHTLPQKVESLVDYTISKQQLCFYGLCPNCRDSQEH